MLSRRFVAFIQSSTGPPTRIGDMYQPVARSQGKIVRQETTNIDAQYERKRKQTQIQKKM